MLAKQKGQAVIESLVIAFALIGIVSLLLWGIYLSITVQWCDYWVYRGNMCLVEGNSKYSCQNNLEAKIRYLVPANHFWTEEIWMTSRESKVRVYLDLPVLKRFFTSEISLPLANRI